MPDYNAGMASTSLSGASNPTQPSDLRPICLCLLEREECRKGVGELQSIGFPLGVSWAPCPLLPSWGLAGTGWRRGGVVTTPRVRGGHGDI